MKEEDFFKGLTDYEKDAIIKNKILEKVYTLTHEGMMKILDSLNDLKADIDYTIDI